jgi:hypothetical protein
MPTEISGSTGVNKIQDNTIVNADINSSAAIAGSKLVMPTGSVLQVVSKTERNYTSSTTADTWISTNHYIDITPSATSSKILVSFQSATCYAETQTNFYVKYSIFRDSTNLGDSSAGFGGMYAHSMTFNDMGWNKGIQHLDSPSSTSSLRYRVYFRQNAGHHYHDLDGNSSLTAMEIAG